MFDVFSWHLFSLTLARLASRFADYYTAPPKSAYSATAYSATCISCLSCLIVSTCLTLLSRPARLLELYNYVCLTVNNLSCGCFADVDDSVLQSDIDDGTSLIFQPLIMIFQPREPQAFVDGDESAQTRLSTECIGRFVR